MLETEVREAWIESEYSLEDRRHEGFTPREPTPDELAATKEWYESPDRTMNQYAGVSDEYRARSAIWERNDPHEIAAHKVRSYADMLSVTDAWDRSDPHVREVLAEHAKWADEHPEEHAEKEARRAEAERAAEVAERAFADIQSERALKIAEFLADVESREAAASLALYVDAAAILSGDLEPVRPTLGARSDGRPFIYNASVNLLFGEPESGKTLVAAAIAADTLFSGGSVVWIDVDYNGAEATLLRLRSFGVSAAVLSDPKRFRLVLPEDKERVIAVVRDAGLWKPTLAVVDSISEILGLFGANGNADEDYTPVHRQTLAALAKTGAGVVAIDHEAKGQASKAYGAGGAVAKKRAIDGVMLRVTRRSPFKPGEGGKADLTIVKDRHGGVRAISPSGEKEPLASTFELSGGEATTWKFWAPAGGPSPARHRTDAEILGALNPIPKSQYAARGQLGWGAERTKAAFAALGLVHS